MEELRIKKIDLKFSKKDIEVKNTHAFSLILKDELSLKSDIGVNISTRGRYFFVTLDAEVIPFENIQKLLRRPKNSKTGHVRPSAIYLNSNNPGLPRSLFSLGNRDFFKVPINGIKKEIKRLHGSEFEVVSPAFATTELLMKARFIGERPDSLTVKVKTSFLEECNILFRLFELEEKRFCQTLMENIFNYQGLMEAM